MKCKCGKIMAEIYYTASIYFFCSKCFEESNKEGIEKGADEETIALRIYIFSGGYKEPMEEW